MTLVVVMFLLGVGLVIGGYAAVTYLPAMFEERQLSRRLHDVSLPVESLDLAAASSLVMKSPEGPLPSLDRLVAKTSAGSWLSRLIDQSGVKTTASAIVMISVSLALFIGLLTGMLTRPLAGVAAGVLALLLPVAFLVQRRGARLHKFEEQFPEALDLMARALRAGHAFQTSLGMAADEMKEPVGPEFKKTYDQQNYGLPLRDALQQMTERVPLLDVRFFVTAVLIQRETGGNLSEILDNLAHVVRERFKIRRQVRVYTAHGRFTAGVLLSLPAALAIALMFINPEHMNVLFKERMGQTLLVAAIVMQGIGFIWIRNVIKIEV